MAQSGTLRSRGKPLFGEAVAPCPEKTPDLAAELNRRLREKYRNYERAALRLELRGDYDSAQVLRRAAGRARLLRNRPANDRGMG
ncbi:hypothetical protein [Hyphococcus luteus]|uniref:Uncharacterized protein n=1 Tax=Hyphococcus luteus TaxID=2058213 RepID=A0A2S7K6T3_9PROT|nr:hypothetical protein [Marinicaulis flavus]PQA88186.1 hypothetical protein CW354_07705 [Marinicaulis flavus]